MRTRRVMGGNMRARRGYGREYEDKKGLWEGIRGQEGVMGGNMRTRRGYGREYEDKKGLWEGI